MAKNCVAEKGRGAGILAILKEVQKNCHHVDVVLNYPSERKNRRSYTKRESGLSCIISNSMHGWITEDIARKVLDN
jgi:hypothetical protein